VPLCQALLGRHGTNAYRVLGAAASLGDLGAHFGGSLYAAEVDYLLREEWAQTGDDVLWRRTKCGLHLTSTQRQTVDRYVAAQRD
jgi:glycerol-3-phosphate dehydrogenase